MKSSARCGETERPPDPADRALRHPGRLRHRARRPVRRIAACPGNVLTITRSTSSSVIVRGPPGRSSSCRPSRRCSTNRERHLPTVIRDTLKRCATSTFDALRAGQHDAAPQRQRLRRPRPTRPTLERLTLVIAEHQRSRRPTSSCHPSSHRRASQRRERFRRKHQNSQLINKSRLRTLDAKTRRASAGSGRNTRMPGQGTKWSMKIQVRRWIAEGP